MIDLSGNMSLSFGAQYMAEDTASYILYRFDSFSLTGRAVDGERLAKYFGITLDCENLFADGVDGGLGVLAAEPQCWVAADGTVLNLKENTLVIESDILYRGGYKLYNYALILFCSRLLFEKAKKNDWQEENEQLSFGLDTTPCTRNVKIKISDLYDEYLAESVEKANAFAQCLAMPKNRFKLAVHALFGELEINRNTLVPGKHLGHILSELSETFCVPEAFVLARLRELNFV